MGEVTRRNLYEAFVGEAKAYFRLLAYAEKATEEELPEIATFLRAVAEAERIHATRHLGLLQDVVVKDTETNLKTSFEREDKAAAVLYPRFIQEAEDEGEQRAVLSFSQARDVEEEHADLYRAALRNLMAGTTVAYHVCQVCGYVAAGEPPGPCPVCQAPRRQFKVVT